MIVPSTAPIRGAFRKSNRKSSHHRVLSPKPFQWRLAMTLGRRSYGMNGDCLGVLDKKKVVDETDPRLIRSGNKRPVCSLADVSSSPLACPVSSSSASSALSSSFWSGECSESMSRGPTAKVKQLDTVANTNCTS